MESTQSRIELDDGAITTVETWGTQGPVILCVHGMASSRRSWLRFANRYADRYRVVAYDQRGHGESAQVSGPMTLERGVRDFEHVAAQTGAEIAIGHSWGGAVVIRGGLRVDARAVIAIDPMIVQVSDQWYAEYIDELNAQLTVSGAEREARLREEYAAMHDDDLEGKILALREMSSAPIAGLRDQNRGNTWNVENDIASYGKPLLLMMAGPQESIVPPAVMERIRAHHGAGVQIVTFEKQGHTLHRTDFEGFSDEVDEFLAER